MEYVQKYIYHPDPLAHLKDIFPRFVQLKKGGEDRMIVTTIKYIMESARLDVPEKFLDMLKNFKTNDGRVDDMAQTVAEYLHEKGRVEGVAQGVAEGERQAIISIARKLCAEGLDPQLITQITELSLAEVKALWRERYQNVAH